jgi:hypothetical protein
MLLRPAASMQQIREGEMRATFFAVPLVLASLLPAYATEKTINLKLVTKHLETKDGEARFFGVTITPEGASASKIGPSSKRTRWV